MRAIDNGSWVGRSVLLQWKVNGVIEPKGTPFKLARKSRYDIKSSQSERLAYNCPIKPLIDIPALSYRGSGSVGCGVVGRRLLFDLQELGDRAN
jgi:hypothetical protein